LREIRSERPEDAEMLRSVITDAFEHAPHASGTEAAIVDALREAGALAISLVAIENRQIVGHVAFSPVAIKAATGWYGLGPVSVRPDRQRKGIGSALIVEGLSRLVRRNAQGCVVLGDPGYYGRFGFVSDPELRFGDAESRYFQRLAFTDFVPKGDVAFGAG
jgi:putative acetyltransferase